MPSTIPETPEFIKQKEVDDALDLFEEQQCGLSKHEVMKEPPYLRMNLEVLKKKDPDELSEASYLLAQYSLNIQRSINRLKSWKFWSANKMDELVGGELEKVGNGFGWGERTLIVKSKSEICKKLNGFIRELDMKLNRLSELPNNIKIISDSIKDLKFAALKREKISHD